MILRWLKLQLPIAHAEKALEYVGKVLELVQKRAAAYSEPEALSWMISQIEYVKLVLIERSTNRSKLREIDFGTGDPVGEILERESLELYEALSGVNYIASQIDDGWEIELQELEDSLKTLASFKIKS